MKQKFNVKYRLDGVLIEVQGLKADTLEQATEQGRRLCLLNLTREYKGMTLDYLNGYPAVVGVETADAWDD